MWQTSSLDMMRKLKHSELAALASSLLRDDTDATRSHLQHVACIDVRLPERKNRPARETPLMVAAERGNLPLVRWLISRDANVNGTNEYRQRPLLYAIRSNHLAIVNLLLKSGADPNLRMSDGDFVLCDSAMSNVDIRIARSLIRHGADPCMANAYGATTLHLAASQGRLDIVRLLIRCGASVNPRGRYGPLRSAIVRNRKEIAIFLIKHGADPRRQPESLGVAASDGRLSLVKMLIEKGWNLHSTSHQGRTPLQHARDGKHKAVIRALLDAGAIR